MVQREDIKIRTLLETDLAKVNWIDRSLVDKGRVTTWPFSFEAYWQIYRPNVRFVAEYKGVVVGFLLGIIEKEDRSQSIFSQAHKLGPPSTDRKVGWIDMMGVNSDDWQKGIGRALVEAFGKECKQTNAIMRIIVRENDEGLKNFLTNMDFKKWEVVTYEKQ